jgi:hypothetical protein
MQQNRSDVRMARGVRVTRTRAPFLQLRFAEGSGATAERIAYGAAQRALKAGNMVLSVVLQDANDKTVSSSDSAFARPARRELLPRCLVTVPHFGIVGSIANVPRTRRVAGGDLPTKCREQPQVPARQRS